MNSDAKIILAAFTKNGISRALELSRLLGGRVFVPKRFAGLCSGLEIIDQALCDWTGKYFHSVNAMIFIGACGIATRAISRHITDKLHDPAVIVMDELGKYVIPVLSGHIGGANDLARRIAALIHAQPVITTATDVNNILAVDEWAVKNSCVVENPSVIKKFSGALLECVNVGVAVSDLNLPSPFPVTLWLRPKVLVLGAGCNRGVDVSEFERCAIDFLDGAGVNALSLRSLASVDIKADEPALKSFAAKYDIPFLTFRAEDLQALPGKFTRSEKVLRITGTDNICERSCMKASGAGAVLLRSKCIYDNVTLALARVKFTGEDIHDKATRRD